MGSIQDVAIQFRRRGAIILKEEGITGLMKRVVVRLGRKPFHRGGYIVALSLDHLIGVPIPAVDVEIDQVKATDDNDLEMLTTFGEYGGSKTHLLQRLAEGQRCYVAKSEGRIIAVDWVLEGEFGDSFLGRRFKLADDELYYEGGFTVPEFRGKGIMPQMVAQSVSDIKTHCQHKTRGLAFIEASNKASLRTTTRMGFKRVGRVGFVEIFGVRFHYLLGRNVLPETTQRFSLERG